MTTRTYSLITNCATSHLKYASSLTLMAYFHQTDRAYLRYYKINNKIFQLPNYVKRPARRVFWRVFAHAINWFYCLSVLQTQTLSLEKMRINVWIVILYKYLIGKSSILCRFTETSREELLFFMSKCKTHLCRRKTYIVTRCKGAIKIFDPALVTTVLWHYFILCFSYWISYVT